jgi:peptidoglycan-N-acetylglucosamine deacetylase
MGALASLCAGIALSATSRQEPATNIIGCTTPGREVVKHGGSGGKQVALTFDDGPKQSTDTILHALDRFRVHATFFVIGGHVAGDEDLLHKMIETGNEIGNHTMHHTLHASLGSLQQTDQIVRDATGGFTPCLFRPPFGNASPRNVRAARSEHLQTILWTVDSEDDKGHRTGPIYHKVMEEAKPGAIILMHDGGNNRQPTLHAVPRIIRGLRHRGYKMVTVTELLGGKFIRRAPQQP